MLRSIILPDNLSEKKKAKIHIHDANSAESFRFILVVEDFPRTQGDLDFHLLPMKV